MDIELGRYESLGLADAAEAVARGERLTPEQGLRLAHCPDPTAVGALAHAARRRAVGDAAHFVVNRHINYTNVCVNACAFCAYRRERGANGAFHLTIDEMCAKAAERPEHRLTEIHVVGGCHPDLPLAFFEDLLKRLRETRPEALLKCFTAVEIDHFARLEGIEPAEVLARLQRVGLAMLPGGGAEIFAEPVRSRICPNKIGAGRWLDIHRQAHRMGIRTNCTMLYGHLESWEERIDHLVRLRKLQDETGGFVCFIPLSFQVENNSLGLARGVTGIEDLKTIAVSRLLLDNIDHVKAYWVMLGVKLAQTALWFGADDLDGTVVEEKIGHMAGAASRQWLTRDELVGMIAESGFRPVERDSLFNPVKEGA